jgi:hypothetical protein
VVCCGLGEEAENEGSLSVVGWKGKGEEVKGAEKGSFVCRLPKSQALGWQEEEPPKKILQRGRLGKKQEENQPSPFSAREVWS